MMVVMDEWRYGGCYDSGARSQGRPLAWRSSAPETPSGCVVPPLKSVYRVHPRVLLPFVR